MATLVNLGDPNHPIKDASAGLGDEEPGSAQLSLPIDLPRRFPKPRLVYTGTTVDLQESSAHQTSLYNEAELHALYVIGKWRPIIAAACKHGSLESPIAFEYFRTQLTIFIHALQYKSAPDSNVIDFSKTVPRGKYPFLEKKLEYYFIRDHRVREVCHKLHESDITHLGHLVQLSPSDVNAMSKATDRQIYLIRKGLWEVGLDLNMQAPGWTAPKVRYFS